MNKEYITNNRNCLIISGIILHENQPTYQEIKPPTPAPT